jgi:LmbE family N-acetylglucosaminyl deacetylase
MAQYVNMRFKEEDMEQQKIAMVIGAHPDDPDFGSGGTVAKWIKEGIKVIYVICTNGDKGSSDPEMTSEKLAEIRTKEQLAAATVLGVTEVVFLGYPDGGLEETDIFRGQLVRLIRKFRPDTVITHDPYRKYMNHHDHRIAGQVALDAIFPYARDILFYPEHRKEGLTPYKVKDVFLAGAEEPNTFMDIAATFDIKTKAIACHVSQIGDHAADFEQWAAEHKKRMVAMMGRPDMPYCEAFRKLEIRR